MRHSFAFSAVAIIGTAVALGGCTLLPTKPTPSPSPIATPVTKTTLPLETGLFASPSATIASPSATKTTKGGLVKGATTPTTTTKTLTTVRQPLTTLYDTSFDSWYITNFPGQDYEKELILYNKSDKPVLYSVRAADRFSDSNPVSVNGTFEATGKMLPLSQEVVKLKAQSSDKTPGFSTTITINFINESSQILTTKTVTVTAYTATGDRIHVDTDTPTDKADNQTADVTYRSLAAYPIRLVNRNQRDLKFEAKIVSPEAAKVMGFSAKSGFIRTGNWWDTDIHFLTKDARVNEVTVEFTFFAEGNDTYRSTKTLTLKIK